MVKNRTKRNNWSVKFTIIEIDDAGTGDLVGDAIIGFYIPEKEKYLFKNIPVNYFQEPKWQEKYPQKYTATLIETALIELEFNPKADQINICTGNIFDDTRKMFKEKNITYNDAKIEGNLQDRVEQAYLDHLNIIGVDTTSLGIGIESGKKRYFQLFSWVVDDFHKRKKFVKSGFKGWVTKWEKIALNRFRKRNRSNSKNRQNRQNSQNHRKTKTSQYKNYKRSYNKNNRQSHSNQNRNNNSNNNNNNNRSNNSRTETNQQSANYSKVSIKSRNRVKDNFHGKKFN